VTQNELIIVRHGLASGSEAAPEPALTDAGRLQVDALAERLQMAGVVLDRLYHSPRLRAAQTAEILTRLLGKTGETAVTTALLEAPSEALLAGLEGLVVGVVGHFPAVARLTAWLAFGDPALGAKLEFDPAAAAWLRGTLEPGGMRLVALLPPRLALQADSAG
jgi:phosphohistidine phosphatase